MSRRTAGAPHFTNRGLQKSGGEDWKEENPEPEEIRDELEAVEEGKDALYVGAVDWLEFGVAVSHSQWDRWRGVFQAAKEAAGEGVENGGLVAVADGLVVEVNRNGRGTRTGYGYCKFIVKFEGIAVMFIDRAEPTKNGPNVFVQIPGRVCLTVGHEGALEKVGKLLQEMGATVQGTNVSRVDLCVDTDAVSVADVVAAVRPGPEGGRRIVTRARSSQVFYGGVLEREESLYLGADGGLQVKFYDKLAEATGPKHDPEYLQELELLRWGGKREQVTRIEWVLRGDELKERGIASLEDLDKLPDVLLWLTIEHTRFVVRPVKSNNYDDTPTSGWWQGVSSACLAVGPLQDVELLPVPKQAGGQFVKQAQGCMAAEILRRHGAPDRKSDALTWAVTLLEECGGLLDAIERKAIARKMAGKRGRTALFERVIQALKNGGGLLEPESCYTWGC